MSGAIELRAGDCVDVMRSLEPASVDAVVTDPPYGINFMGKAWDGRAIEDAATAWRENDGPRDNRKHSERGPSMHAGLYDLSVKGNRAFQRWTEAWANEALRVLKPGGHMLVFGGTRTYHRMVCGLEDAGFEIRDQLAWMFGSGFPKSLDVSKAIDAANGKLAEREKVGTRWAGIATPGDVDRHTVGGSRAVEVDVTLPATDAAREWQGWGTALKPGYEPVVLARKPLAGTVAANVLEHGVGALNVDGCRIETSEAWSNDVGSDFAGDGGWKDAPRESNPLGRWPANVVLDEEAAAMLDEQSGWSQSPPVGSTAKLQRPASPHTVSLPPMELPNGYGDSGGASRFFYCAKVDSAERNAGLSVPSLFSQDGPDRNIHPTVKPVDLMRWLCRLITPPGGLILDPFMGSGSTGIAAHLEGFRFLGVEREPEYMEIARSRISHWAAREVAVA